MPQLPTAESLGVVGAQPNDRGASIPYAGAVGEAQARTGQAVAQAGGTIVDIQDDAAMASAEAQVWKSKDALDQKYKNDPDPATAAQRYSAELQGIADQAGGTIIQPRLRTQFADMASRYVIGRGTEMIQNQADAKLRSQGAASTLQSLEDLNAQAARADDPGDAMGIHQTMAKLLQSGVNQSYFSPEWAVEKSHSMDTEFAANWAAARNPADIAKLYSDGDYGKKTGTPLDLLMPAQIRTIAQQAQKQAQAQTAPGFVHSLLDGGTSTMPASPNLADAIHQQESGGKPGDWQIQYGTFKQYAKPGEDFDNPADHDKVAQRIIGDLSAKYGGDPQRVAVGYFSGEGNVAPPGSPTPWKQDLADKNGKTTSSYVQDITQRLGGGQATTVAQPAGGWPSAPTMASLNLTPQESYLYQHHLDNLTQGKAVKNADGSTSTLLQMSVEHDGKTYNIPSVWDGKELPAKDAIQRAAAAGWDKWPSYASEDAAEARYSQMHDAMERDIPGIQAPPQPGTGSTPSLAQAAASKVNTYGQNWPDLNDTLSAIHEKFADNPQAEDAAAREAMAMYHRRDASLKQSEGDIKGAQVGYMQAIIAHAADPTQPDVDMRAIANDPRLAQHPEILEQLATFQSKYDKKETAPAAEAKNVLDVYRRINLPAGSPGQITSIDPIIKGANDGLYSPEKADYLVKEFNELKDPQGESLPSVKASFLAARTADFKSADPTADGEKTAVNYQQWVSQQTAEYRKAGKNPFDLFKPGSKDYIGSPAAMAMFQKTMAQRMADQAAYDAAQNPPPPEQPGLMARIGSWFGGSSEAAAAVPADLPKGTTAGRLKDGTPAFRLPNGTWVRASGGQ